MARTHAELIDALGGGTKVAEALSNAAGLTGDNRIDCETVYKWKVRGVAWRWRIHVARLARAKGEEIPDDFLDGVDEGELRLAS